MAKEEQIDIENLRQRGLTCNRLKSMEQKKIKEAQDFRKVRFNNIAVEEESIASKISQLRKKVCLLK